MSNVRSTMLNARGGMKNSETCFSITFMWSFIQLWHTVRIFTFCMDRTQEKDRVKWEGGREWGMRDGEEEMCASQHASHFKHTSIGDFICIFSHRSTCFVSFGVFATAAMAAPSTSTCKPFYHLFPLSNTKNLREKRIAQTITVRPLNCACARRKTRRFLPRKVITLLYFNT